jgi:hypothetical protein
MTAPVARAGAVPIGHRTGSPLGRALASLYVGAAAAVALVMIMRFLRTSPSENTPFQYVGDYVLTADGIPLALSLLTLLPALRTLQHRRDGWFGRAGTVVAGVGAGILIALFVYDLVTATSWSLGPTYVLTSVATDLGVILFAVGAWRARLLPRWLVIAWPLAWTFGSMLPFWDLGPLVLAAVYVLLAVTLPRRVAAGGEPAGA